MHVLITCKYEKDLIKNSWENVIICFPHYKSMGIFFDAQGQQTVVRGRIRANFELMQALMYVIVICKY